MKCPCPEVVELKNEMNTMKSDLSQVKEQTSYIAGKMDSIEKLIVGPSNSLFGHVSKPFKYYTFIAFLMGLLSNILITAVRALLP